MESKQAQPIRIEGKPQYNVSKSYDDSLSREHHYRRVYPLYLPPNQSIQIDLLSKELDPLLRAYDDSGKLIAENDDWGGSRNSRLYLASAETGRNRFFIVATATRAEEGGFEIELRQREPARFFGRQLPITVGQSVSGKLEPTSPLSLEKQVVYDTYAFEANAGDAVKLVATPTDSPVGLELRHAEDKPFTASANLPGRPVSIYGTLKATGHYVVMVSGSPSDVSGYKLDFTRLGTVQADAAVTPVTMGQEINAQFTPSSPILPGTDRPFALYRFDGHAGQAITVAAAMSDTQRKLLGGLTVEIGLDTPVGFATTFQATRSLASAARATFDKDGSILIRVTGPSSGTTSYRLRILPQNDAARPSLKAE
jgi:hypothetical protein